MEYYSSYKILKDTCTSLKWNGPIYDMFSSVLLIGQTNRHLYKITHLKNTASNLFLDYIEKEALRCNKEERFHGRFWSPARQQDVLTDRISFKRLRKYFERLAVNG